MLNFKTIYTFIKSKKYFMKDTNLCLIKPRITDIKSRIGGKSTKNS